MASAPRISVRDLELRHSDHAVLHGLTFEVHQGDVFVIMGGSGSGKSTLLKAMIGLIKPTAGTVALDGKPLNGGEPRERQVVARRCGVLLQSGALWNDLTLLENVMLPIELLTNLGLAESRELAEVKLALVGVSSFGELYPDQVTLAAHKRAGLARAMALDPEILLCDEPSAGLDPVSARGFDDLIIELRDSLNMTFVIASQDLASIFAIASNGIFLDEDTGTLTASGAPRELLANPPNPRVRAFLTRETDTEFA